MAQFTTTQVAEKLDTTPRTLRKFLRADARAADKADTLPGKGSRYAIEGKDLQGLKKRFAAWQVTQAEERAARAAKAVADAKVEVEAGDNIELTDDEVALDDEEFGPTDAELDAIED